MTLNSQLVDGKQTLDAQQNALNFIEQATFSKVLSYAKATGTPAANMKPNEVVTQDVPITDPQLKPLHLEALDVGADATAIITQQLQAGKIVVFHDTAYVSGAEKMVLGFR